MNMKSLKKFTIFLLVTALVFRADVGAAYGSMLVHAFTEESAAENTGAGHGEADGPAIPAEASEDPSENAEDPVPSEAADGSDDSLNAGGSDEGMQPADDIIQEPSAVQPASNTTVPTDLYTGTNVNSKIRNLSLNIKNTDGADISTSMNVPWDMAIQMKFNLTLATEDHTAFHTGDYVELTIPDEILIGTLDGEQGDVKEGDITIAKVRTEDQKLTMTFTDEIEDIDYVEVYFTISAAFNREAMEEGGERELVFEVDGETKFTVNVGFEEVDMKVEKTLLQQNESEGVYYQEWKLTVNTEGKELHDPIVKDLIPEGAAYVNHRLDQVTSWNVDISNDKREVTFTYNGMLDAVESIYITTCTTDFTKIQTEKDRDGNVTDFIITNKVTLNAADKNGKTLDQVSDEDIAVFSPEWIVKNGTFSINDRSINWTLDVNQDALVLSGVRVTDIIPKNLTLDETSLEILKNGTEKITGYTYSLTEQADGTSVLVIELGDIADYYKINYETKVYDAFFNEQNSETFANVVCMEWIANGRGYKTPTVTSSVTAENKWIEKNGGYWWPRRLYNEWVITINPNRNELDGKVTITDHLPLISSNKFQQVFNENRYRAGKWNDKDWMRATLINEEGDNEVLQEGTHYTYEINDKGTELTLIFEDGVVDQSKIVLYLESELPKDAPLSAVISNTQAGTYTNRVRMFNANGTQLGTDTHGQWTSRRISEKTYTGYDENTRTATWRIEVNPYQHTGIGALSVRDELPEFMTFDDESNTVTVYRTNITQRSGGNGNQNYTSPGGYSDEVTTITDEVLTTDDYSYTVTDEGSNITFEFDENTVDGSSYIIEFTSTVSDEFYAEARESTVFRNYSYTSIGNLTDEWDAYADMSKKLTSTPLEKKGTYNPVQGIFTWEILINQDAVDVDYSGVILEDQLQEGLVLDIASVNMQKKNGSSWTEMPFDQNVCIAYDYGTNLFTFTMPDYLETKTTYRLSFDTDILKSGTYSNSITMKGYLGSDPEYAASETTVSVTEFDGIALTSKKLRINLNKTDTDGRALSGAVFELRTADGIVLETAESGIDGKIAFQSLLSRQTLYYLYEVSAPTGYRAKEDPIEVYIHVDSNGNALQTDLTYTAVNEEIYVPVNLVKTNTQGQPLAGAEFSVTPFYWEYHADGSRTPIAELPYDKTYISGNDGTIDLGSLPFGLYVVQEEKAPSGYMKTDSFLVVEITYPKTEADGDWRVLYWDAAQDDTGSYEYIQRTAETHGARITHITNEEQLYKLTIYKTDKATARPLADTEFKIYHADKATQDRGAQVENPDRADGVFVTDSYGRIEVYLPVGYYQIEEVKPPRGYTIGTETVRYKEVTASYTPPSNTAADAAYAVPQFQVNFENEQITETVVFRKVSEEGSILPGAKFNLYKLDTNDHGNIDAVPALDDAIRVIASDSKGFVKLENLTEGLYALQETVAPTGGYVRSLDIYAVELKLSEDSDRLEKIYYKIKGGVEHLDLSDWDQYRDQAIKEAMDQPGYYDIINEKEYMYYNLTVYKRETGTDIPLSGAVFELWTDNGTGSPETRIIGGADADGHYITNYAGEINVQLTEGAYLLKEIEAPSGYTVMNELTKVNINGSSMNYKKTIYNKKLTKPIAFTKVSATDNTALSDAVFNLYQFYPTSFDQSTALPVYDDQLQFDLCGTIKSDNTGRLELEELSEGWYALQEVNPPAGYDRSLDMYVIHLKVSTDRKQLDHTVYVIEGGMKNWQNIQTYDRETIPNTMLPQKEPDDTDISLVLMKKDDAGNAMAGVSFYVMDEDGNYIYETASRRLRLTTNSLGIAAYEGTLLEDGRTYTVVESPVPEGYRGDAGTVAIRIKANQVNYIEVINEAITAEVTLHKKNRYGEEIKDASFNVYKIDAQRQGNTLILNTSSGSYMEYDQTVKSGEHGEIELGHLTYGCYAIQEAEAAVGYQRNLEEIIGIEITSDGAVNYYRVNRANHAEFELLEDYDETIYNDYEGYRVRILKEDVTDLLPLEGAVFEIYTYDEATEKKGRQIRTDGAAEDGTYTTDAYGEINVSLPVGTYMLEETEAPYMYRAHPEADTASESLIVKVDGSVNELTREITNDPILTSVTATKIADNGNPLAETRFNLHALNVSVSDEKLVYEDDTYIKTLVSDSDGIISAEDLSYGWYALQEAVAPEGYIRSLDVLAFHIMPDGKGGTAITYYDIFGGMKNVTDYQERTVADAEDILLRNEAMNEVYSTLVIRKVHRLSIGDESADVTGLAGARFRISQAYDEQQRVQIITEQADPDGLYTTDTYGSIRVELPPGSYIVEEVEAPDGYVNISEPVTVVISEEGDETIVVTVENATDTELAIHKVDQDQKELTGAAFTLYRKIYTTTDGTGYRYIEEGVVDMKDCSTEYLPNLRTGEYVLMESAAPEGYQQSEDVYEFSISAEHPEQEFIIENIKLRTSGGDGDDGTPQEEDDDPKEDDDPEEDVNPENVDPGTSDKKKRTDENKGSLIKTGDTTPVVLYVTILAAAVAVIGYLIWKKRRKR